MTRGSPLVVMGILMVLDLIRGKLLIKHADRNSPKLNKLIFHQTKCCSMTKGSPLVVMRILMVLDLIRGKLLIKMLIKMKYNYPN